MSESSPQRDLQNQDFLVSFQDSLPNQSPTVECSEPIEALIQTANALRHDIEKEISLNSDQGHDGNEQKLEQLSVALDNVHNEIKSYPVTSPKVAHCKVTFLMDGLQYTNPEISEIDCIKSQILSILETLTFKS
jgi:hypothetical protein